LFAGCLLHGVSRTERNRGCMDRVGQGGVEHDCTLNLCKLVSTRRRVYTIEAKSFLSYSRCGRIVSFLFTVSFLHVLYTLHAAMTSRLIGFFSPSPRPTTTIHSVLYNNNTRARKRNFSIFFYFFFLYCFAHEFSHLQTSYGRVFWIGPPTNCNRTYTSGHCILHDVRIYSIT